MALYSDVISEIRKENRDLKRRERDVFDGDGTTTVFIASKDNIYPSSYTVKISGVVKTEGVDYTFDKDAGELVFTTAPASGNDNVTLEYQYVRASDAQYLNWLNDGIDHFRKKLWEEIIDDDTLTTVADANEIDLTAVAADVEDVVKVEFKDAVSAPSSLQWSSLNSITNVGFLRGLNKLRVSPALPITGWPLKVHLLKSFTKGTATSDTFAPTARFVNVYKLYAQAEYVKGEAYKRLHETSAVTKEGSFIPAAPLFAQAKDLMKEAEAECSRVRMPKPAQTIPILIR